MMSCRRCTKPFTSGKYIGTHYSDESAERSGWCNKCVIRRDEEATPTQVFKVELAAKPAVKRTVDRVAALFDSPVPKPIRDDEPTALHVTSHVPALEDIEVLINKRRAVAISFYDPSASIDTPWLWLDTPTGVVRVFAAFELEQLSCLLHTLCNTPDPSNVTGITFKPYVTETFTSMAVAA